MIVTSGVDVRFWFGKREIVFEEFELRSSGVLSLHSLTKDQMNIIILLRHPQTLQSMSQCIHVNEDALDILIESNLVAICDDGLALTTSGIALLSGSTSGIPHLDGTPQPQHTTSLKVEPPSTEPLNKQRIIIGKVECDEPKVIKTEWPTNWQRMSKKQRRKIVIG